MFSKKLFKRIFWICLSLFILMNVSAYFHAYKFTHFNPDAALKTKDAKHLSFGEKAETIFFGINNPRPENKTEPSVPFETIKLKSNKEIECWKINTDSSCIDCTSPKGTVILFHGYSGQKSSMLDKADIFLKLGYNVLLPDFMGSGGSEGNQTTIGFYEAEEVKTCVDYISSSGEKNIILFGTSMGAAAIMKAMNDHPLPVSSIILECPFGSMLDAVKNRFAEMNVPVFPMAYLLVFWGGVQNGFNAFNHCPSDYGKNIHCPALLLYGEKDEKVTREEIDEIFKNIAGEKKLITYPDAGHENYLRKYKEEWKEDIKAFLKK